MKRVGMKILLLCAAVTLKNNCSELPFLALGIGGAAPVEFNLERISPRSPNARENLLQLRREMWISLNPFQLVHEHVNVADNFRTERLAHTSAFIELTLSANWFNFHVPLIESAGITFDRIFEEMGNLFPNVTRLVIHGSSTSSIDHRTLSALVRNFRRLTHLDISNNSITQEGVQAIADHAPQLQELIFAGNRTINDESLRIIAQKLINLTRLDLSNINTSYEQRALTTIGFSHLSTMRSLRLLSLVNNFITQDDILALRGKITKVTCAGGSYIMHYDELEGITLDLEVLDLTHNPYITLRLHDVLQSERRAQPKLYRLIEWLKTLEQMKNLVKIVLSESQAISKNEVEQLISSEQFPYIDKIIWKLSNNL